MFFRSTRFAALAALSLTVPFAAPLAAGDAAATITVEDPYIRTSHPGAPTGAAFMMIKNTGTEDDRLVAARSDIAARVELHTHIDAGNGVMEMREVEGGFAIPAGGMYALQRGGDHVMFMGLTRTLETGDVIPVELVFEKAGNLTVEIQVDLDRKPDHGAMHKMPKQGG